MKSSALIFSIVIGAATASAFAQAAGTPGSSDDPGDRDNPGVTSDTSASLDGKGYDAGLLAAQTQVRDA